MDINIVAEILTALKVEIEEKTGFTELDYSYEFEANSERALSNRYGLTSGSASFVNGSSIGRTTLDHTFTINLTNDYQNKDDDVAYRAVLANLYSKHHGLLCYLQKSRLALPTPTNRVNLISGLSFDEPEIEGQNGTVALRLNINVQYSYKNN